MDPTMFGAFLLAIGFMFVTMAYHGTQNARKGEALRFARALLVQSLNVSIARPKTVWWDGASLHESNDLHLASYQENRYIEVRPVYAWTVEYMCGRPVLTEAKFKRNGEEGYTVVEPS